MGQLREQKVEQAASLLSVALILLRKSATGWQPVVQIVVNAHVTDPVQSFCNGLLTLLAMKELYPIYYSA